MSKPDVFQWDFLAAAVVFASEPAPVLHVNRFISSLLLYILSLIEVLPFPCRSEPVVVQRSLYLRQMIQYLPGHGFLCLNKHETTGMMTTPATSRFLQVVMTKEEIALRTFYSFYLRAIRNILLLTHQTLHVGMRCQPY